ncbi:TetR family transcriptional regulator C-terminal domain-containing protein [Rhodobacteraceae bacterium NNCM2]|nr:TetR family transcriptional regulator C-terminal domain-containing protein [Coraliihabitans acroporae]
MEPPGGESTVKPRKERAENAARRRQQIIEATKRSIVQNGLAQTTLATVAKEAGLSQGVAVFYFKNKQTLLGEVLSHQYAEYQKCWEKAREEAGPCPTDQLIAMVRADFDRSVCDMDSLVVWHAFWGEASARPHFSAIADSYDTARFDAMTEVCAAVLAELGRPTDDAPALATAIDALTDGLWLRIHLSTAEMDHEEALGLAARFLAASLPERADRFLAELAGKT